MEASGSESLAVVAGVDTVGVAATGSVSGSWTGAVPPLRLLPGCCLPPGVPAPPPPLAPLPPPVLLLPSAADCLLSPTGVLARELLPESDPPLDFLTAFSVFSFCFLALF